MDIDDRESVCFCLFIWESISVCNVLAMFVIIPEIAKASSFRISAMLLFNDRIGLKTGLILPDFL